MSKRMDEVRVARSLPLGAGSSRINSFPFFGMVSNSFPQISTSGCSSGRSEPGEATINIAEPGQGYEKK